MLEIMRILNLSLRLERTEFVPLPRDKTGPKIPINARKICTRDLKKRYYKHTSVTCWSHVVFSHKLLLGANVRMWGVYNHGSNPNNYKCQHTFHVLYYISMLFFNWPDTNFFTQDTSPLPIWGFKREENSKYEII